MNIYCIILQTNNVFVSNLKYPPECCPNILIFIYGTHLDHFLPVNAKERSEDVDGGASSIPPNRRHILNPLGHVHELKVVLPVDLGHHLDQLLTLLFCHLCSCLKVLTNCLSGIFHAEVVWIITSL